jgi:hypothetical protein
MLNATALTLGDSIWNPTELRTGGNLIVGGTLQVVQNFRANGQINSGGEIHSGSHIRLPGEVVFSGGRQLFDDGQHVRTRSGDYCISGPRPRMPSPGQRPVAHPLAGRRAGRCWCRPGIPQPERE